MQVTLLIVALALFASGDGGGSGQSDVAVPVSPLIHKTRGLSPLPKAALAAASESSKTGLRPAAGSLQDGVRSVKDAATELRKLNTFLDELMAETIVTKKALLKVKMPAPPDTSPASRADEKEKGE